jgi:hypothetical protein
MVMETKILSIEALPNFYKMLTPLRRERKTREFAANRLSGPTYREVTNALPSTFVYGCPHCLHILV